MTIRPERQPAHIRRLITSALQDPAGFLQLDADDLDMTLRVLRRARLLARLAFALRELGLLNTLPLRVADQLNSALVLSDARARLARWELTQLANTLQPRPDSPVVVLKGCAYLLLGLPNANGRMFADVDLLVPEPDLRASETRLLAAGWSRDEVSAYDDKYYRQWTHEIPALTHVEREVEVDLHHNILMRTARLQPSAKLLLEKSREIPGSRYRVLAPVDLVLHAMTHLFYSGEMEDALRELVDIDQLLRHFSEHEPSFWAGFVPRAAQLDLLRPAFYGLRYASRFLGTPVPPYVLAAVKSGGPIIGLGLMDRLVPRGLYPRNPDHPGSLTSVARMLLLVRSHWIRMPPWLLLTHLTRKLLIRARGH